MEIWTYMYNMSAQVLFATITRQEPSGASLYHQLQIYPGDVNICKKQGAVEQLRMPGNWLNHFVNDSFFDPIHDTCNIFYFFFITCYIFAVAHLVP